MERFSFTLNQKTTRKKLKGKEYIVAPLSMLVSGVLNGSKGPLLYPTEEIEANPEAWNGMPIVVNHPYDENKTPISARSPEVLENSGIGHIYNVKVENGVLKADGWFSTEDTARVDNSILNDLESGREIELSTGLFTDQEEAPENAVHNDSGKKYTHIARNYRPDHLAILPTSKGACSIADGCGVLVNEEERTKLDYLDEFGYVVNAELPPNAKLNKPFRTPGESKKFAVYVKSGDSTKIVRFGDPNMEIKRDNKKARDAFRSRHNCSDPGPKDKPRYWSCKMWEAGKTVSDVTGNEDYTPYITVNQKPNDLSVDEFREAVHTALQNRLGTPWVSGNDDNPSYMKWFIQDIYIDHVVVLHKSMEGKEKYKKYDFTVSDNVVSLSESDPVEVTKRVTYTPVPTNNSQEGEMTKTELVANLINNCDCWEKADEATLNKMSEEQLKALQPECGTVTANTEPVTPTSTVTPTVTVNAEPHQMTEEQWMAQAPPSVQRMIANAQHVENSRKQEVASKLVANLEEGEREAVYNKLMEKDVQELELMLSLVPQKQTPVTNYSAAAMYPMIQPGQSPTANKFDGEEDILSIPSVLEETA